MNGKQRRISPQFDADLLTGTLRPLLDVVRADRDLILEVRDGCVTIYCKGQCLASIKPNGGGYAITADQAFWSPKAFWKDGPPVLTSAAQASDYVATQLPFIKQTIAVHAKSGGGDASAKGLEIEYEQFLIRANNNEPSLNTEYFAVDRQYTLEAGQDRLDVLGVCWPRSRRHNDTEVALALMEVKFSLAGGVDDIAVQVKRYHDALVRNIDAIADDAEYLLRLKLKLGLITGASPNALSKLATLPVSRDPKKTKIVQALVDYNPHSKLLDLKAIGKLPFADQIEIHRLGLGLWSTKGETFAKAPADAPA
ncbi:hypothetical protein [Azospirillum soli]|uniref:hypothetical protein n=1 Tax=Azospirillum soli TaxID=1304799 RepID=UPI001AEACFFC|nr:hypothetical protein [Azospirillum soli]MBP2312933.1 hypothetical protein [Azospirillum soli]